MQPKPLRRWSLVAVCVAMALSFFLCWRLRPSALVLGIDAYDGNAIIFGRPRFSDEALVRGNQNPIALAAADEAELPQSEGEHLYYENIDYNVCKASEVLVMSETLFENGAKKTIEFDSSLRQPYLGQICLATHGHHHKLSLTLTSDADATHPARCEVYASTKVLAPSSSSWDWKLDSALSTGSLELYTFMNEFRQSQSGALFLSASASHSGNFKCVLELQVSAHDNMKLLSRTGLRGGQVLLPRDVRAFVTHDGIKPVL